METKDKIFAKCLMDIKAVMLRPDEPFVWASGWHSPIYCDNRKILSHPSLRTFARDAIADVIAGKYPDAEIVAGVATGAIAIGALVADKLQKPFIYVRPKPKDHGTGSQIEGILEPGRKVVVVEDLISTGMSSLAAVDALRKAEADVLGMVALFTYGFPLSLEQFRNSDVELTTLSDYPALLETAKETGYIGASDYDMLKEWRNSPSTWGQEK
jgi:orotate phosphoribosyltransferase